MQVLKQTPRGNKNKHLKWSGLVRWASFGLMTLVVVGFGLSMPANSVSPACPNGLSLAIAAHQDDDILFMNPDIYQDIQAQRCILTAFLTAGDANEGAAYWQSRENGAKAAYANMVGAPNTWTQSTITITGRTLVYNTLDAQPTISLLFMRLPDGKVNGSGFPGNNNESLQKLWAGTIATIHPVDGSASYSKSALIATLAGIIKTYQPDLIRAHDYNGNFGDGDHSDHHAAAYFVLEAHRAYSATHTLKGYRGYNASSQPANVFGADKATKESIFLAYAAHDHNVCQTPAACQSPPFAGWIARQYTSGMEIGGSGNVTALATITASSQNTGSSQQAGKVADGYVNGFVAGSQHNHTREWATVGGKAGSWVNAAWISPHTLTKVILYDRPNLNDQVTAGTLSFSDGTSMSTGALPNDGSPKVITFAPKTVTSLRFTVTGVSATTQNVGLAELQAYETNVAPLATTTASSQNLKDNQGAGKAIDGYATGWPVNHTREWATTGGKAGSWLKLTWEMPQTLTRIVLFDRPNTNDQITAGVLSFSDGSTISVPSLPNSGSPFVISFPAKMVTSVQLDISAVKPTTANIGLSELQAD